MTFTKEQVKEILQSDELVSLSRRLGCNSAILHYLRNGYKRSLGLAYGHPPRTYVDIFTELKAEGVELFVARKGPHSASHSSSSDENSDKEVLEKTPSGDNIDPIAELEIAFRVFKDKLNEIIPQIVEQEVREAVYRASRGSSRRMRILK